MFGAGPYRPPRWIAAVVIVAVVVGVGLGVWLFGAMT
jgi:hypothetical protein